MSMVREWWAKFRVRARHARDHGTSAVEYGLLVAAVAAVIVGVTFGLGNLIKQQFQNVSTSISTCSPDPANCPAGQPVPTVTK
jgi:pilus assembly protein Flp/PilA